MNTLGERLKQLRGDTPGEKVAEAIGIPYATYRSYEANTRVPRDEVKVKIANYFSTSILDIFYHENDAKCDN